VVGVEMMKAVDSGPLAAILEGDPSMKMVVRQLRGVEVASTEISMIELSVRAHQAPAKNRAARLRALENLRRKITVLPIDSRAGQEAVRRIGKSGQVGRLYRTAELAALEVNQCDELLTYDKNLHGNGKWRFKITILRHHATK